ncbi:TPA: hypothetical protein JBD37_01780 [Legionella pneumophila subsp. pneumophila]|uniref:Uncharacterized protein n=1 Tax=Legionella pneumophila TaxID=446 RepID=A0A378K1R7_LEGPN|nr:hypothetical protein [Legionella pneumophila]ABQ54091.1 hypothetical protein LPC_0091 [Legionella pneumophila str. Corby]ADG23331.1 hypothetical protein lpa_00113 [Legionella pneumophila 2300/99 Alcoy]MCK1870743.1 hypothetical protein [Legionella pneumophila]MCO1452497.1 hypothetical protein [Legionella pneumophila]MCW8401023.1 hypothetical protein [Legionella pneumophila]
MDASKGNNHLKSLNKYSWFILVMFIFAVFAMSYQTTNTFFDGFIQTLPLIIVFVFWSEKSARLIKQAESNLKRAELFNRDTFILSFSFLLGCLISLLFAYDNSDVKGWWVLIIYFITLYGLIFSLIFSGIALQIKNHKTYTLVFSLLIIVFVSMGKFFPRYTFIPLLGYIDTFYAVTCVLLIIHCLFAFNCKIIRTIKRNTP